MSELAPSPLPLDVISAGRLDRLAPRLRLHVPAAKDAAAFHEQWLGLAEPDAEVASPAVPAAYLVGLLETASGGMNDGELVSAWEQARAALAHSAHRAAIARVAAAASTIGPAVARELQEVHGRGHSDEVLDWDVLGKDLTTLLSRWGADHAESSPARAFAGFLATFAFVVARRHRPSLACRQLLVLKLENHLHRVPGVPAGIFRRLFEVAFQGLARWTIQGAYQEQRHADGAEGPDLLGALALLREDPDGTLFADFLATITLADLEPSGCIGALLAPTVEGHLEPLRKRYEANEFDGIDAIRRWAADVRSGVERSSADIASWDDRLGSLAEDLAQGMKGKDTAQLYHQLFRELLARSAWFSLLAPNASGALDLLVRHLVSGAGMEPQGDLWRKHPQITASLQNLLASVPQVAPWRTVRLVLAGLEQRLQEARGTGLAWASEFASEQSYARLVSAAGGGADAQRVLRWLLARAPVEIVLGGRSRLGSRLRAWSMTELWPVVGSLPGEEFRRAWDLFLQAVAARQGIARPVAEIAGSLRDYGRGLPAATAAEKIRARLDSIAASIVDRVFAALPEYAASVGESGAINCRADNLLTLRKVSELLTQQPADPVEALSEWWNAVVGGYLKNRTSSIFEQNLQGIYSALGQELDPAETEAAFQLVQEVYRQNFGVDCRAARSAHRLPAAGAFGRLVLRLDEAIPAAQPDLGSLTADAALASVAARYLASIEELGDLAASAGRVIGSLAGLVRERGAESVANGLVDLAADLRLAGATHRLRLAAPIALESLAEDVAGLGLASLLGEHRAKVAAAVSDRLASARPELFSGDRRNACRRDQSLVLEKWTELFGSETVELAMVNGLRYQVELLGPYIHYGEDVFTLTWNTVEEVLAPAAGPHVRRLLARWVSRQVAAGGRLGPLHEACKHVFDPRGYVFSARETEERTCRDLVGAAMVLTLVAPRDHAFGEALLRRIALADPAGPMVADRGVAELRETLGRALAGRAPESALSAIHRVLDARERIAALAPRLAGVTPAARAAATLGGRSLRRWQADAAGRLADGNALEAVAAEVDVLRAAGCEAPEATRLASSGGDWLAGLGGDKGTTPLARRLAAMARADRALCPGSAPTAAFVASADLLLAGAPVAQAAEAIAELGRLDAFAANPLAAEVTGTLAAASRLRAEPPVLPVGTGEHAAMFPAIGTGIAVADRVALRLVDPSVSPHAFGFGPVDFNHAFAVPAAWSASYGALRTALAPLDAQVPGLGARVAREISHGPADEPMGVGARILDARGPANAALQSAREFLAAAGGDELASLAGRHLAAVADGLATSADLESVVAAKLSTPLLEALGKHPASQIAAAYRALGAKARRSLETGPGLLVTTIAEVAARRPGEVALARRLIAGSAAAADRVAKDLGGGDSCRRDQSAILEALGGLLVKHPASTTALLILRDWVFAFLPHLATESAREAAAAWRRHEETFGIGADAEERAVVTAWSQLFAAAARRLGSTVPAVSPAFVKAMHETRGALSRDEIREVIGSAAASLLAPDTGLLSGRALLARGLLASSASSADPAAVEQVIGDFLARLDRGGVKALPGFNRRLSEVPGLVAQFRQLADAAAGSLARVALALSHHGDAATLWRLAALVRFEPGVGISGRDPADSLAGGIAGWKLPEDRVLETAWQAHRRVMRLPESLAPAPTTKPGALFGLIVPAAEKVRREVAGDAAIARETARLVEEFSVLTTLGHAPAAAAAAVAVPAQVARRLAAGQSEAVATVLRAVVTELPGRLGDHHPAVEALAAFAERIPALALAARLDAMPSATPLARHLALVLRGSRDAAGALAYLDGRASERTPEKLGAELRRVAQALGELPEAEKARLRQLTDAVLFEATT